MASGRRQGLRVFLQRGRLGNTEGSAPHSGRICPQHWSACRTPGQPQSRRGCVVTSAPSRGGSCGERQEAPSTWAVNRVWLAERVRRPAFIEGEI